MKFSKLVTGTLAGLMLATGLAVAAPTSVVAQAPLPFGNPLGLTDVAAQQLQAEIRSALAGSQNRQISQFEIGSKDMVIAFPLPGASGAPQPSDAALLQQRPYVKASGIKSKRLKLSKIKAQMRMRGSSDSCPWSWSARAYCFYENKNFNGRRVTFIEERCQIDFTNLSLWGSSPFNDKTSSWVNNSADVVVKVYRDTNLQGGILWKEGKASNSPYVGDSTNDRASSVRACR